MEEAKRRIAESPRMLDLRGLGLTELPPLPEEVRVLDVAENKLTRLPALPATLEILYCEQNLLEQLPPLPPGLQMLTCSRNRLRSLPPLPPALRRLDCAENRIERLPPLSPTLAYLNCASNRVTELPEIPATLDYLDAANNLLTEMPFLPARMSELELGGNPLRSPYAELYHDYMIEWAAHNDEDLPRFLRIMRAYQAAELRQKGRNLAAFTGSFAGPGARVQKENGTEAPVRLPFGGPAELVGQFLTGKKGYLPEQRAKLLANFARTQGGYLSKNRFQAVLARPYRHNSTKRNKKSRRKTRQRRRRGT